MPKNYSQHKSKYYFFLRAMMIKGGLGVEDTNPVNNWNMESAKLLERASSNYEKTALATAINRRTISLNDHDMRGMNFLAKK